MRSVVAVALGLSAVGCRPSAPVPAPEPAAGAAPSPSPSAAAPPEPPEPRAIEVDAAAPDAAAPRGPSCLARHYDEAAALALPWDDGRDKAMAEKIASPDLEDMLSAPYVRGPIAAVDDPERDPGRARVEALFRATYGATPAEVEKALVPVTLMKRSVRIHRRVAAALRRVSDRLEALGDPSLARFFAPLGGTFNPRAIAGTDRTSAHAWGIALDLNPALGDYWRNGGARIAWKNRVPESIVAAFEAEGFVWGGRWYHYDTMHFEYRPELFDPDCR